MTRITGLRLPCHASPRRTRPHRALPNRGAPRHAWPWDRKLRNRAEAEQRGCWQMLGMAL
jgi:hypothetical protein